MAKQFKYIDTAGKSQTIQANSADEAMKNASNIASNSGVMAVDTLSRPADTRVDRGVEVVNNFQTRNASPALRDGISRSISTPPPQEVVRSEKDQQRDLLLETTQDILGTDIVSQRQQAREDAGVIEKEKRARLLSDQLTKRDREIQKQLEKLEQNPQGKGDFALDADIARFNRESARELADLSFSYNVALGDYQSAEKIANEYISDIQADLTNKQNAWQMLYQLVQNDMTESEKIQAQQNFQREQTQEQFELNKKMALFEAQLQREQSIFAESLKGQKAPEIVDINGEDYIYNESTGQFVPAPVQVSQDQSLGRLSQAKSKVDQLTGITEMAGIDTAVGTSILTRTPGGFWGTVGKIASVVGIPGVAKDIYSSLSGNQQNFISEVEQIRSTLNLDTLVNAKKNGATFGALSNQELQVLASSATKIGTWAIVDKNGKVVGYNTSEENFKKEIDKINNFAKIDYILKGGNPQDVGVQVIDGQLVTQNSDGTITVLE